MYAKDCGKRRLSQSVIAILAFFICARNVEAQVLESQSKPANELLDTYLARMDHLSEQYCVKIEMSKFESGAGEHSLTNYYILSASSRPRKMDFLAFGEEYTLNDTNRTLWEEKLRFEEKQLVKVRGSNRASVATNRLQKQPDGTETLRLLQSPEVFNPLSLPIYSCSLILMKRADPEYITPLYKNRVDFERSTVESKTGNVVGDWLFHTKRSVAQLVFGAKVGYMPIEARFYKFDAVLERANTTPFSTTKTLWKRAANGVWLPSKIELDVIEQNGKRREFEVDLEWAAPERLDKSAFDIEPLMVSDKATDWQGRFSQLFQ